MITKLKNVTGVCTCQNAFEGTYFLALKGTNDSYLVVASPSWHVDYDGYITWPPTADYRESWLADIYGGDYPPRASKLRRVVADWLATADLSPLEVGDALDDKRLLIDSLWAVIRAAQGETSRGEIIRLRVTDEEKTAITTAAGGAGQTLSEYMRSKLLL